MINEDQLIERKFDVREDHVRKPVDVEFDDVFSRMSTRRYKHIDMIGGDQCFNVMNTKLPKTCIMMSTMQSRKVPPFDPWKVFWQYCNSQGIIDDQSPQSSSDEEMEQINESLQSVCKDYNHALQIYDRMQRKFNIQGFPINVNAQTIKLSACGCIDCIWHVKENTYVDIDEVMEIVDDRSIVVASAHKPHVCCTAGTQIMGEGNSPGNDGGYPTKFPPPPHRTFGSRCMKQPWLRTCPNTTQASLSSKSR